MTKRLTAQERRMQILHSAIKVFATDTYHGATTKKISEEAGITEALIYRYFGSKRKLFTEAIEHTSDALITGLEDTLRTHRDDPFEAIRRCFQYYIDVLERHSELAKMIFLVLAELDSPDVRDTYLPHQERILKAIKEAIEYWHTQGFLEESAGLSPKTGAWLYYGTYLILALVKHSHGNVALDVNFAVELSKPYFTKEIIEREEARYAAESAESQN